MSLGPILAPSLMLGNPYRLWLPVPLLLFSRLTISCQNPHQFTGSYGVGGPWLALSSLLGFLKSPLSSGFAKNNGSRPCLSLYLLWCTVVQAWPDGRSKSKKRFKKPVAHKSPERERTSQNHRMFGVGRDLCGSPSPSPLPKQGHLQQAAQDLVQAGLEYLQRRRLHNLPGTP